MVVGHNTKGLIPISTIQYTIYDISMTIGIQSERRNRGEKGFLLLKLVQDKTFYSLYFLPHGYEK
jgi:hypothetical protein